MPPPTGTPGKSQDARRLTGIGEKLMRWDSVNTDAINRQAAARSELGAAYIDLPTLGLNPADLAAIQQEFIDVDTKMVTDSKAYSDPLVPIS